MNDSKEPTNVFSLRLPASKAAAFKNLAAVEGREPAEQLEYLAIEALITAGLLPPTEVEVHRLREGLISRFVEKAAEIYDHDPRPDIIAETAKRIMSDANWLHDYEAYTQLHAVNTIHPTFGRRVKLRLKLRTGKNTPCHRRIFWATPPTCSPSNLQRTWVNH